MTRKLPARLAAHGPARSSLACALLTACCLATLPAAQASELKARPGIGNTPAFICIATTVTERGHTKMSRVSRSSGNAQADFRALKLARKFRFVGPDGKALGLPEREAHLLVRMHQNGRFAHRLFELSEPLPEICSTPAES